MPDECVGIAAEVGERKHERTGDGSLYGRRGGLHFNRLSGDINRGGNRTDLQCDIECHDAADLKSLPCYLGPIETALIHREIVQPWRDVEEDVPTGFIGCCSLCGV